MNKQMKNLMMIVMVALLLAACAPIRSESVPAEELEPVVVVENKPTDIPAPVESVPTATTMTESDPEQYIGLTYLSLPEGLSQGFGMVIWGRDDYGLSMVMDGAEKMLWLEKVDHYNEDGSTVWSVKDVLTLSNLESGLTLIPDGCSLNGTPDSEIIVAGRNGVVVLAWRANTNLEKFEVIPADGITCNSDKAMPIT